MNSKEAFQLVSNKVRNTSRWYEDELKLIQQDLDRLEKLEKENKVLRERVNHFKNVKNRHRRNQKFVEKENTKLKKVIEIIIGYLIMYNDVSFETFMTSQCDDEEQEICREVFKEVWENA